MGKILTASDDPHSHGTSLIDTRGAVLLEHVDVVAFDNPSDGRRIYGLELQGRLNRSSARSDQLYLLDVDGAAALVSEICGLFQRAGETAFGDFTVALDRRLDALPKRGGL